jgi:hypothetical protein
VSPQIHDLKTWPEPFQATWNGERTYEVRRMDRPFAVGAALRLLEWSPATRLYTGRTIEARVSHMTEPGEWDMPDDLCVMGLVVVARHEEPGS